MPKAPPRAWLCSLWVHPVFTSLSPNASPHPMCSSGDSTAPHKHRNLIYHGHLMTSKAPLHTFLQVLLTLIQTLQDRAILRAKPAMKSYFH